MTDISLEETIRSFNNTGYPFPEDKTIHSLFEEQVERTPHHIAAMFRGASLTYRELNEKANSLAYLLREKGVRPDVIVGILLERSLEMIVGIFAILKAGGAYLPISPAYPVQRVQHLLRESAAPILLTQTQLISRFSIDPDEAEVIPIDLNGPVYTYPTLNLQPVNSPHDLVYVIYTSGSTGKPKGVGVEHYSLVNRLNWMQRKYPISLTDTILQKTPYFFDVSVWEMFWWSIVGARVSFLIPGGERFPQAIIETVQTHSVTVMHFVPSMMSVFLEYLRNSQSDIQRMSTLRQVFASGEKLTVANVRAFYDVLFIQNKTQLANLYGPTEATVDVTYYDCPMDDSLLHTIDKIPIGKPIDNTQMYILGENGELLPVGETGELYIGGVGVARGYLNNPQLTSERFILFNPQGLFLQKPPLDPAKTPDNNPPLTESFKGVQGGVFQKAHLLYKTGDLARWLDNGNIEYLGRQDFQVKIHGLRIELGEIESVLSRHPLVRDCAVIVKQFSQNITLIVGYIVPKAENVSSGELKEYLKNLLPEYMVPNMFVIMENFPLTPSGKVDRNALPDPSGLFGTKK